MEIVDKEQSVCWYYQTKKHDQIKVKSKKFSELTKETLKEILSPLKKIDSRAKDYGYE